MQVPFETLLKYEIGIVRKIVRDEVWLEGERRKCPVSEEDMTVQLKVTQIVLAHGEEIRYEALKKMEMESAECSMESCI